MGFTKTTRPATINVLTGDGNGGFWHVTKDGQDATVTLDYAGENAVVESIYGLFGFNTFREFLLGLITNNIALPVTESRINVNSIIEREGLQAQFDPAVITNADLNTLRLTYDVQEFCQKFGVLSFIARYFVAGIINVTTLADIYISLGQQGKANASQVEAEIDALIASGDLTQAQKNAFTQRWLNEVL